MIRRSATLILAAFSIVCPELEAKDSGCTVADFKGTFGLVFSGVVLPGLPISGDFARVGKVVADGQGVVAATTVADYNGINVPEEFQGTYTVTDDCHLTWKSVLPTASLAVTFDGVIVADGDQVTLLVTSPGGAVIQGTLLKQKAGGCQTSAVAGGHALKLSGQVDFGLPFAAPYNRVGQAIFDAAGHVYVDTIVSYGGAMLREQFNGTYLVDSECHLTVQAKLPWPLLFDITVEGVVSADNSHILLMQTAPAGTAITGDLWKQGNPTPGFGLDQADADPSNPAADSPTDSAAGDQ